MKALIIIAACIALALVFRIIEELSNMKAINSVGCKSNKYSKNIARVDITNAEELKKALEHYKGLAD